MSLLRAFSSRSFAVLWAGQAISNLGDNVYSVALAWWVLQHTGSAAAMGVVLIGMNLPTVPMSLVGGVVSDRFPRLHVMLVSDLVCSLAVGAVAVGATFHFLALWQLVALSIVFGTAYTFYFPAYGAALPDLLPADALTSANALRDLSTRLGAIGGVALGGLLVAAGGTALAFTVDALSFVVAALCLVSVARLPALRALPPRTESALADLREGLSTVLGTAWLWITLSVAGLVGMVLAAVSAALPLLVRQHLHGDVHGYAALQALNAAGAVVATVALGRVSRLRHRGVLVYGAWFVDCAAMLVLGLPIPFVVAGGVSVLAGASVATLLVAWATTVQELVPPERLGRVLSLDVIASEALSFVGFGLGGVAADRLGAAPVFLLGGATGAVIIALAFLHPAIRKLD